MRACRRGHVPGAGTHGSMCMCAGVFGVLCVQGVCSAITLLPGNRDWHSATSHHTALASCTRVHMCARSVLLAGMSVHCAVLLPLVPCFVAFPAVSCLGWALAMCSATHARRACIMNPFCHASRLAPAPIVSRHVERACHVSLALDCRVHVAH